MLLTLLESILLIVNAVAILNQKRFLKKCTNHLIRRRLRHSINLTQRRKRKSIVEEPSHHDDLYVEIDWEICTNTIEYHGNNVGNTWVRESNFNQKMEAQVMFLLTYCIDRVNDRLFRNSENQLTFIDFGPYFKAKITKRFMFMKFNHVNKVQITNKNQYNKLITFFHMSQYGSRVTSPSKNPILTQQHSYVSIQQQPSSHNNQASTYSTYSIPNKHVYTGTSVNTYKTSRFTADEVSKLTGSRVKEGSVVKGASRIEYVPYEKKVTEYETRTIKEMVPKTRKVVDYAQRKIVQTVPREVVKQDFYAVEKITQYYKQIIPEKKVEIVPVQKKVKKIQYVPVEKQIVHYPQNEDWRNIQGQSRVLLESQGIAIRPDAEYKPIQSDLLYKYANTSQSAQTTPVGYVDLGSRRYLSTAPTIVNPNMGFSNVNSVNSYIPGPNSYMTGHPIQGTTFQQSQVYTQQQPTFIHRVGEENFSNIYAGNKYEYRYGNIPYFPSRENL